VFDEIFERMNELAALTRGRRYDGHHDAVMGLIDDAERALTTDGKLGPWERAELDRAALAVRINFLTLALNCIGKAIEVSQLPAPPVVMRPLFDWRSSPSRPTQFLDGAAPLGRRRS
jgi:hypothetical protein